jgi:hypothetical protein
LKNFEHTAAQDHISNGEYIPLLQLSDTDFLPGDLNTGGSTINLPISDSDEARVTSGTCGAVKKNSDEFEDIDSDGGCVSQARATSAIEIPDIFDIETCNENTSEDLKSLIPMLACILVAVIYRFVFV